MPLRLTVLLLAELPTNRDLLKLDTAIGFRFLTWEVLIFDFDKDSQL